jgi:hypothetical protein
MKSVGEAANDMVNECMKQFPRILAGKILPYGQRMHEAVPEDLGW